MSGTTVEQPSSKQGCVPGDSAPPYLIYPMIERLAMKPLSVYSLVTLLFVCAAGLSPVTLVATEGSRETIQWHLDYFTDSVIFDEANYQTIGGPWSRILDPSRGRINERLNRILQTTSEDGPGSVSYALPKTLLQGEYPLEIVFDIGNVPPEEPPPGGGDNGGGPDVPGGGKLHAFRAAGLILPEHQIILQNGDEVVAWAEITPEGTAVHLGGEIDEFGSAVNPTVSAQGDGINLDNLAEGIFTRLVLRLSESNVSLSFHSGRPRDFFGPAYQTTNFEGLGTEYIELATLDQSAGAGIDTIRFATNGGRTGIVAINTIAVFGHEMPEGIGPFIRGDVNSDSRLDIADAVFVFSFLFTGGSDPLCLSAMNTNAEISLPNLTDGIYLLNYFFMGGSPPPEPYPECGISFLEADLGLGCESTSTCD